MKVILIKDQGYQWHVPLSAVAKNRAAYYAERDKDTTYQDEFDYVMEDEYEGLDWFLNNMDFCDVADDAVLVVTPPPLKSPGPDAEYKVLDVAEQTAPKP
jgi:hypothetical protein